MGAAVVVVVVWFASVRLHSLFWPVLVIHGPDESQAIEGDDSGSALRIGAYNIAHGRGTDTSNWEGGGPATKMARLRTVGLFLASLDLDVVVLNEVDFRSTWSYGVNQAEVIAEVAGFPYWVEQHNFNIGLPGLQLHFGNAVLSRHPIVDAERLVLPPHSRLESIALGRKDAVVATIELPSKELVRVLGVHLARRRESVRVASAELMKKVAADGSLPLIAAGDFNSGPLGFPEVETDEYGRSALSVLVEHRWSASPLEAPGMEEFTFSAARPRKILDWVVTAPGTELIEQRSFPIALSDHRPVMGIVRLASDEDRDRLAGIPPVPAMRDDDRAALAAGR